MAFNIICTACGNVTFHEGSGNVNNPDSWLFSAFLDTPTNDAEIISNIFTTPFVSTRNSASLYLTTDVLATIRGVIHGYNTTI